MFKLKPVVFFVFLVPFFTSCAQHKSINISSSNNTGFANINTKGIENDILLYINQYRTSIGMPVLKMVDDASNEAAVHSTEMAGHIIPFGHEGFETRITNIQKSMGSVHAAAENVAYGMLTAKTVVDGWLNSSGHKKNIEGNYNLTGIGVAKGSDGLIYFTQIFLSK